MKKVYEAWLDDAEGSTTFAVADTVKTHMANGLLSKGARLLHRIEADTFEEAQAVHHVKMGWSPFIPVGTAQPCPRKCGAMFYPDASGECPNCGKIC